MATPADVAMLAMQKGQPDYMGQFLGAAKIADDLITSRQARKVQLEELELRHGQLALQQLESDRSYAINKSKLAIDLQLANNETQMLGPRIEQMQASAYAQRMQADVMKLTEMKETQKLGRSEWYLRNGYVAMNRKPPEPMFMPDAASLALMGTAQFDLKKAMANPPMYELAKSGYIPSEEETDESLYNDEMDSLAEAMEIEAESRMSLDPSDPDIPELTKRAQELRASKKTNATAATWMDDTKNLPYMKKTVPEDIHPVIDMQYKDQGILKAKMLGPQKTRETNEQIIKRYLGEDFTSTQEGQIYAKGIPAEELIQNNEDGVKGWLTRTAAKYGMEIEASRKQSVLDATTVELETPSGIKVPFDKKKAASVLRPDPITGRNLAFTGDLTSTERDKIVKKNDTLVAIRKALALGKENPEKALNIFTSAWRDVLRYSGINVDTDTTAMVTLKKWAALNQTVSLSGASYTDASESRIGDILGANNTSDALDKLALLEKEMTDSAIQQYTGYRNEGIYIPPDYMSSPDPKYSTFERIKSGYSQSVDQVGFKEIRVGKTGYTPKVPENGARVQSLIDEARRESNPEKAKALLKEAASLSIVTKYK